MRKEAGITVKNKVLVPRHNQARVEGGPTLRQPLFFLNQIFILCLVLIQSCKQRDNNAILLIPHDTITLNILPPSFAAVQLTRCEAIFSRQQLRLEVRLPDKNRQLLTNPGWWEIETREGNRATPIAITTDTTAFSDAMIHATLIYEPIHSRELFHRTGLRGDVEPAYRLTLDSSGFGGEENLHFDLQADKKRYSHSLEKFGLDSNIHPYHLALGSHFIQAQQNHLTQQLVSNRGARSHSIHLNENEILINGFWLRIQSHHKQDTLYVMLRLVNQTASEIQVNLNTLALRTATQNKEAHFNGNCFLTIPNGRRTEILLKFPIPVEKEFLLDLAGFTIRANGRHVRIFHGPMSLLEG